MSPAKLLPSVALLVSIVACQTPEGQEWIPTAGLSTTVVDDYDAEVSLFGLSGSAEVDYSTFQFEVGGTRVTPAEGRDIKHEFAGFSIGLGELEIDGASADLVEISGGGRFYFDEGGKAIPFFSLWSVISDIDDPLVDTPQLGLRVGGGAEVPFSEKAALVLGADLTFALVDAEDSTGIVQSNAEGFAVRIGFSFYP